MKVKVKEFRAWGDKTALEELNQWLAYHGEDEVKLINIQRNEEQFSGGYTYKLTIFYLEVGEQNGTT